MLYDLSTEEREEYKARNKYVDLCHRYDQGTLLKIECHTWTDRYLLCINLTDYWLQRKMVYT